MSSTFTHSTGRAMQKAADRRAANRAAGLVGPSHIAWLRIHPEYLIMSRYDCGAPRMVAFSPEDGAWGVTVEFSRDGLGYTEV
jgi:hypothetical protein